MSAPYTITPFDPKTATAVKKLALAVLLDKAEAKLDLLSRQREQTERGSDNHRALTLRIRETILMRDKLHASLYEGDT